jgi:para-aminobenzoate synthetase component I
MKSAFPYKLLSGQQINDKMNSLGSVGAPFLFVIDFKAESGYVIEENELDQRFVQIEFNQQESGINSRESGEIVWETWPVSLDDFKPKFDYVVEQIRLGNSFLTNLTQPTEVKTNLSLLELFQFGSAKYKLWLNGLFTVLSPETFVTIREGRISSFPMKGTIDASIPKAEEIILNDPKERAEHATIVDLIRNDLSLVASEVEVKRYRYIEKLTTNKQDLLQVSSEISGRLPSGYQKQLGDILFSLLPAGSISGAPKPKTLEIIQTAEGYIRGFYTGICGWFDGQNLDSAVMIRFVEEQEGKMIFKSGGGITSQSDLQKEYEELIQKVYVPIY